MALLLSNDRTMRTAFSIIVPRTPAVNTLILNPRFRLSGVTDSDIIAHIGASLDVDFVVTGHIRTLGDRRLIMLILIQVSSLRQIAGAYREFHRLAEIPLLLSDMGKPLIQGARRNTATLPTLALLPFIIPETGVSVLDGEVLSHLLTIELTNTGVYTILPRVSTILTALNMAQTRRGEFGTVDQIRAIGEATQAPYVLTSQVMRIGEDLHLFFAQILSTSSATLRAGDEVEYRNITDALELIPELAFKLTGIGSGMPGISISEQMVWVPGGSFAMGSRQGEEDEQPVHTVQVNSFFMGKTPVTQEEYEAVMGNNPSEFKGKHLPVEQVSWYDAVEYCNKLSRQEGLIPAYSGSNDQIRCNFRANGYRLPTEAEWEYAARGGNRDSLSYDLAGGNQADQVGWYQKNSRRQSQPVGSKAPNSLGLYDLAGNVWEWCWDWYGAYSPEGSKDSEGATPGKERILRGGSWNSRESWLRSTYRHKAEPNKRYKDVGFRVLRPSF